jgi:predicted transcriptional regulator
VKARDAVLASVKRFPGIHVREVERQLRLSNRLASYHLQQLAQEGAVQLVQDAGYDRYFPSISKPKWSARDVAFLCIMRRMVAFRITVLLLAGPLPHGVIAKALGLAKASASYHLTDLRQAGVLEATQHGRERHYAVADRPYVMGMLANFTPVPEDHDAFTALLQDLVR